MKELIIKTKKDIAAWVSKHPKVREAKRAAEEDDGAGSFDEVEEELVKLLAVGDGSPDFGEDWQSWLTDNIDEQLNEAIEIIA